MKIPSGRNLAISKDIVLIGLCKGINIFLTFLIVPLTIKLIGTYTYGIWVTLLSVASWFSIVEMGIGNGLRNKLTVSETSGKQELSRIYISTAYFFSFLIVFVILFFLLTVAAGLDFQLLLNTDKLSKEHLSKIVIILFAAVALSLFLTLFKYIAFALKKPFIEALSQTLTLALTFTGLSLLLLNKSTSFFSVVSVHSSALLISGVMFTFLFFYLRPNRLPRMSKVNFKKTKGMFNLGIGFFVIQLSGMIIFSTDNVIISQLFDPGQVTVYSIVMKLFMVFNLLHVIILTPLWSAFTEAYSKNNLRWIRKIFIYLLILLIPAYAAIWLTAIYAEFLIEFWVREDLNIPLNLVWTIAAYTALLLWSNTFGYLLGGLSKIRLGAIFIFIAAVLNIPLSIYLSRHLGYGSVGVAMATICCLLPSLVISPIQAFYFLMAKRRSNTLTTLLS